MAKRETKKNLKTGFSREGGRSSVRQKFIRNSRIGTTEALKSRDMLLGYVTRSIDTMDEGIHLLTEKLEDAYSAYFPELKLEDKKKYAQVAAFLDRKSPDMEKLGEMVGQNKAADLAAKAGKSLG
ncbi:MAG: hypothetical protein WC488_01370, partial [Candidatus Micrarchaeia archaeon]